MKKIFLCIALCLHISFTAEAAINIAVLNFDSKTEDVSKNEAARLTELFVNALSNSEKFAVTIYDKIENIAPECQYILLGSITSLNELKTVSGRYISTSNGIKYIPSVSGTTGYVVAGIQLLGMIFDAAEGEKDNVVTEIYEIIIDVNAKLIEVNTNKIINNFSEYGSAAQFNVITQDKNGRVKNIEKSSEVNSENFFNLALSSAASNLNHKIREALTGEKIQIASTNDGKIIINQGLKDGIQAGNLFCVYSDKQSGGDTNAVILITDVREDISKAEIAKAAIKSYSPSKGDWLAPVLYSDFQKGIWHIKNKRRVQAEKEFKENISISELVSSIDNKRKNHFENFATKPQKVIQSYELDPQQEKALINAHLTAAKANSAKKRYENYKNISDANLNDYLAAYNTGKNALDMSMYSEAREYFSKALFVNPKYKPAKELIDKIDNEE